ncbi:MAG: hypothetical protein R6U13_08705 [Desulfatiglandaceae bacterium]
MSLSIGRTTEVLWILSKTLQKCGQSGFRIEKYSDVSSIIERVKRQVHEDAGFRKRIDELSPNPTKNQGQT